MVVGPNVGFVDEYIIIVAKLVVFTDQAVGIVQIVLNHTGVVAVVTHGEFVYVRIFVGTQQIFHGFVVHAFGGAGVYAGCDITVLVHVAFQGGTEVEGHLVVMTILYVVQGFAP